MCGIVGVISKKSIKYSTLKKMNDKIVHRGPDDEGYAFSGEYEKDQNLDKVNFFSATSNIAFGHRRLSIVDLTEDGHQPMSYKGRYWIVFNGEIYNYIELKEELRELGHNFYSKTDTEVILASYDEWGAECLNRFNGMWAFTIYDTQSGKIFISRDRFGIKPLYYYQDEGNFIFASEIKAILAHPEVKSIQNEEFLINYLQNGSKEYIKQTAFQNIYRFDFSSYFEGCLEDILGNFEQKKFWELKPNLSHGNFDEHKAQEYARKYYELLEDSVRIRLRADVKVGSALSGGLDSSSIVYLVNKLLKEEDKEELQETFSSVYKNKGTQDCDESYFIDIMAQKLGVHSNQIEPKEEDVPMEHEKMIYMMENPPNSTCMSGWHTFKLVSKTDVKVTLDGQGADEQLGGYLPYLMNYISSLSFIDIFKEVKKCIEIPKAKKHVLRGMYLGIFRIIFGKTVLQFILKKILKKDFEINLNQKLIDDTMHRLITLIHYSDHASMGHSIESRMPFMDYRLVEFLASVPACYKMRNGWTKYIARLAFDGKLPDEITWRKDKMGWNIPESYWFQGGLKNWLKIELESSYLLSKLMTNKIDMKNTKLLIRYLNISVYEKVFFKKTEK